MAACQDGHLLGEASDALFLVLFLMLLPLVMSFFARVVQDPYEILSLQSIYLCYLGEAERRGIFHVHDIPVIKISF